MSEPTNQTEATRKPIPKGSTVLVVEDNVGNFVLIALAAGLHGHPL